MRARRGSQPGGARAKAIFRRVFDGPDVEIGHVSKIGAGLNHDVFAAPVRVPSDPERSDAYVVSLPRDDEDPDDDVDTRTRREFALLRMLPREALPLRIPTAVAIVEEGDRPVLVRSYVGGISVDFRAARYPAAKPWQAVAQVATSLHAIEAARLHQASWGHATRRAHAVAELSAFEGLGAEVRDARDWAEAHLPPDTPASLVHGDLLGQNILVAPDEMPGVLDWEYATTGDPAYDLAIVTRGSRRPFQIADGFARLLAAYAEHGGQVTAAEVHIHELCMVAGWYKLAVAGKTRREPPEQVLARLLGILARARAST